MLTSHSQLTSGPDEYSANRKKHTYSRDKHVGEQLGTLLPQRSEQPTRQLVWKVFEAVSCMPIRARGVVQFFQISSKHAHRQTPQREHRRHPPHWPSRDRIGRNDILRCLSLIKRRRCTECGCLFRLFRGRSRCGRARLSLGHLVVVGGRVLSRCERHDLEIFNDVLYLQVYADTVAYGRCTATQSRRTRPALHFLCNTTRRNGPLSA